jgi:hypothetical protein
VESITDEESEESSERVCCPDDLCTGALGPDGVCGTCGRSSIKLKPAGEDERRE